MPVSSAEAKGHSKHREQTEDAGGYEHGGEGGDAKHGSGGYPPWNADTKEGKGRARVLSSLSKPTSPRPSERSAFSSLPSPATASGKLAPLDVGQRSPRSQATPRLSLRSNSPQNDRDPTPLAKGTSYSLPASGSSSPRSVSPRLPPMKSAPSPHPSHDDAALPGLEPTPRPRTGAHSARRVRSLPPNSKRASCADPTSPRTGSGLEFSPLPDAKERDPRRGNSDPTVEQGIRRRGRDGRGRAGSGEGAEVAEAKHGRHEGRQERLPGTNVRPTSQPHDRGEGRRRSSSQFSSPSNEGVERFSRPGTDIRTPAMGGKASRSLSNGNGNGTNGANGLPACGDRADEHRYDHRSEEKEVDSMPNSPSTARGEESSNSPRTRRMRPQRDN